MMKQPGILLILLILSVGLVLSGCAQPVASAETTVAATTAAETSTAVETTPAPEAVPTFDQNPISSDILMGPPQSSWDFYGNGIAECIAKTYPGSVIQLGPGNTQSNLIRMHQGEADFGLTHDNILFSALNGTFPLNDTYDQVRSIFTLSSAPLHFVLDQSLGVADFDTIIANKSKIRISIGAANSSTDVIFKLVLQTYDLTVEDMQGWGCTIVNKSQADSVSMFSAGDLDGFVAMSSAPVPAIVEAAVNKKLILIPFNSDKLQSMVQDYGYTAYTMAAGTYDFQTEPYITLSSTEILAASTSVPDEVVYKLTRSVFENLDYFKSVRASLKDKTPETMIENLDNLHPGALQYYQEIGLVP